MAKKQTTQIVPDEILLSKIYLIRGQKVMLDRDLAELYDIETKDLKRQVKRNIERFPKDFMFELNMEEFQNWRRQFGASNFAEKMGLRYAPYAFTEHGVLMLANVLKSDITIEVSLRLIEVFVKLREMLLTHKDILVKLERVEKDVIKQDRRTVKSEDDIKLIFEALD